MPTTNLIPLTEAAQTVGVSTARLRQMLLKGDLKGHKIGSMWVVDAGYIKRFATIPRPLGKPPKKTRKS